MAGVQYHSTTKEKTWKLPVKCIWPHSKLSCGIWLKKTIDKPLLWTAGANDEIYKYTPLSIGETRVFSLQPGQITDPVIGHLSTMPLDQPCAYEALSYAWSYPKDSYIQVNKSSLQVTANLVDALSHIRSTTETRLLWIDAICINQNDLKERSSQVAQMRAVYSRASRVLVWLGRSTERTEIGMRFLQSCIKAERLQEARWQNLPPSVIFNGIADVLYRHWFQRFWIVQEVALAKEVVMSCGSYQVSWENRVRPVLRFLRTIKIVASSPEWQLNGLDRIDMDILLSLLHAQLESGPDAKLWASRPRLPDLLELVYSMRQRKATDWHDRVYALLGLAYPEEETNVITDYCQSAEEAYYQFAHAASRQTELMCDDLEGKPRPQQISPSQVAQKMLDCVRAISQRNDVVK